MRSPGQNIAGFVPYTNELILSGTFQKKVITVNYNFPGYRAIAAPNVAVADGSLDKNQIFYRETTAPGLYAPLVLCIIHNEGTSYLDLFNNDTGKLGIGSANLIHFWDNSASAWASGGNDRDRYVSSIGADDSGGSGYARQTINGDPTITVEDDADACVACIDSGCVNLIDYVIVDQAIDMRSTAKPAAIGANFAIDALYTARINQRMLSGYDVLPSNFLDVWAAACQRFIIDIPQI